MAKILMLVAVTTGLFAILDALDKKFFGKKLHIAEERIQQAIAEAKAARDRGERPNKRIQIVK